MNDAILFVNVSQQWWSSPDGCLPTCIKTLVGCGASTSTGEHLKFAIKNMFRRTGHAKDTFVLINKFKFIVLSDNIWNGGKRKAINCLQ